MTSLPASIAPGRQRPGVVMVTAQAAKAKSGGRAVHADISDILLSADEINLRVAEVGR